MPTISPQRHAAETWKALARLLCPPGQDRVKTFDPETREYRRKRKITNKLPGLMAAVFIYHLGRTTLLVFDFDAKGHGTAQVDADFTQALKWITDCGGRAITDRSNSGGRHILVPLAIGTTASFEELQPLMAQLKARLATLDIKPNQSPKGGCIAVPGTPCSGGGYRLLDGPISDAVDALTVRSEPTLLPALYALMGTLPGPSPTHHSRQAGDDDSEYITGHDDEERLSETYRWTKPFPTDVLDFAAHGIMAGSWPTPSEARQSVVTNAVLRGYSRGDIRQRMRPDGQWNALGASYEDKHGTRAGRQFDRDFRTAINYAVDYARKTAQKTRSQTHNGNYTQFSELHTGPEIRSWLAYAMAWADRCFSGPSRWTVRDVFQSVAALAVLAGETISGTPLVGVGGRSISLGTGLLSHRATANALQRCVDMVGSPIILARTAVGREPHYYALVTQNPDNIEPLPLERVRVAIVHPAWHQLGRQHRAIYELVVHHKMTNPAEIYLAAKVSTRSGQESIKFLVDEGLLTRQGREIYPGPVTLDAIADAYHLEELINARKERYRNERRIWHTWLATREHLHGGTDTAGGDQGEQHISDVLPDHHEYLAMVMADGPPDNEDYELHSAIELLRTMMGAVVVLGSR